MLVGCRLQLGFVRQDLQPDCVVDRFDQRSEGFGDGDDVSGSDARGLLLLLGREKARSDQVGGCTKVPSGVEAGAS